MAEGKLITRLIIKSFPYCNNLFILQIHSPINHKDFRAHGSKNKPSFLHRHHSTMQKLIHQNSPEKTCTQIKQILFNFHFSKRYQQQQQRFKPSLKQRERPWTETGVPLESSFEE